MLAEAPDLTIGVLALQGGFGCHLEKLRQMGVQCKEIKRPEELREISALIIPGGESTVFQIVGASMLEAIAHFDRPIFGTCAGAIILAKLGLLDIEVKRNGYGRQIHSFTTDISFENESCPAIFIRAPLITSVSSQVQVLAEFGGLPICVRQGPILAASFHPELTSSTLVHRYFLDMVKTYAVEAAAISSSSLKR